MPQFPSAQSRPIGTPFQRTDASTGGQELAQGLNQLGQGVADVGQAYNVHRARAQQIRKQEELTRFNHGITSELYGAPEATQTGEAVSGAWGLDLSTQGGEAEAVSIPSGYMNLKGKSAAAATAQVLDALQKRQREIADGIEDEQLRSDFLAESNVLYEDTRRRMEIHASQQITVAEQAGQKAMVEQGLTAIAAAYDDEESVQTQFAIMADGLRKSALSEEDGRGKVLQLQQTIAKVRVEKFLAAQDFAGAARVLEASNRVLSPEDSVRLTKAITDVKSDVTAEHSAQDLVEEYRDAANGRVDAEAAIAAVDELPEGPAREKLRGRVEGRLKVEGARWNIRVDKVYSGAFTSYLQGGHRLAAIAERDKSWLIENAPEEWAKLEARERADRAAERAGRGRGSKKDAAELARQRQRMVEFRADVATNPGKYSDPTYTPERLQREWGDLASDDYEKAGALFAGTKDDDRVAAKEFGTFLADQVRQTELAKDKDRAALYRARMGDLRRDFIAANKRQPTQAEIDEMNADAWKKVTKVRSLFGVPGGFGDLLVPDSEAEAFTVPRPKRIRGYLYSQDRKRRVPVYMDGSRGAEEDVNG